MRTATVLAHPVPSGVSLASKNVTEASLVQLSPSVIWMPCSKRCLPRTYGGVAGGVTTLVNWMNASINAR